MCSLICWQNFCSCFLFLSFLYVFTHSLILSAVFFRHSRQKELDPRLRMSGTNPASFAFTDGMKPKDTGCPIRVGHDRQRRKKAQTLNAYRYPDSQSSLASTSLIRDQGQASGMTEGNSQKCQTKEHPPIGPAPGFEINPRRLKTGHPPDARATSDSRERRVPGHSPVRHRKIGRWGISVR